MAKGVSIKFRSYDETVPQLLKVIKLDKEISKHKKIILKPALREANAPITSPEFVEAVLQFCLQHKAADAQVFIAEGSDGEDTMDMFDKFGYKALAEKYTVSLLDLNNAEVEEILDGDFLKFERIRYPKVLMDGFIISLPKLADDAEIEMQGSLSNMLGAFPASYYKGLFSVGKSKIKKWPAKYAIHDILRCKMPDLAVIDASDRGVILAGVPLDMDLQAAKLLGKDSKQVTHLRLVQESSLSKPSSKEASVPAPEPK